MKIIETFFKCKFLTWVATLDNDEMFDRLQGMIFNFSFYMVSIQIPNKISLLFFWPKILFQFIIDFWIFLVRFFQWFPEISFYVLNTPKISGFPWLFQKSILQFHAILICIISSSIEIMAHHFFLVWFRLKRAPVSSLGICVSAKQLQRHRDRAIP